MKNKIYDQFQLKNKFETNQNLYRKNQDKKNIKDHGLKYTNHKQRGLVCIFSFSKKKEKDKNN